MNNMDFKSIRNLISADLNEFEKTFKSSLKSRISLLNIIINYLIKTKGKQLRPMFVYLVAGLFGGSSEKTHRAATLIELLHNATLVHDDVVDDAQYRRGFFSLKALWKNKISVLVGDYILSQGLLLALQNKDYKNLEIVSEATKRMSEGEILQLQKSRSLKTDIESYFEVIEMKTASLLASCFAAGAASAGASESETDKMFEVGLNAGMAFQIKDDLLDFSSNKKTGKSAGNDIKEKKLTLPVLLYFEENSRFIKSKNLMKIKYLNSKGKYTKRIISDVKNSNAIAKTEEYMNQYLEKAMKGIDEHPESEYKQALKDLIKFTTTRTK